LPQVGGVAAARTYNQRGVMIATPNETSLGLTRWMRNVQAPHCPGAQLPIERKLDRRPEVSAMALSIQSDAGASRLQSFDESNVGLHFAVVGAVYLGCQSNQGAYVVRHCSRAVFPLKRRGARRRQSRERL
jgi:hypothetical protein